MTEQVLRTSPYSQKITELSKKYNLDRRVVEFILNHFFRFVSKTVSSVGDYRPIRLRYFGLLAIREHQEKK